MTFTFSTAARVVVGPGSSNQVPTLVARHGAAMVILGHHTDPTTGPLAELDDPTLVRWSGEPTLDAVDAALEVARATSPDVIVAWGGGSVIDLAKAVGVLAHGERPVLDHLEVIGAGAPLPATRVPVIAVPTTAGTGAEVTANAPLLSPEHRVKASLRGAGMVPVAAVVDPVLTATCPPDVTAAAGLDALTQCLEPLTSLKANPISDALAREGLARAAAGLRRAFADGSDLAARVDMSLASLLSGMALANAKLGAVHGLAAPLGGMTGAAHGRICAAVLAATTEVNVQALTEREPENPALPRYAEAARLLTGDPAARVTDAVAWIRETVTLLGVPPLGALGLDRRDHGQAADAALVASSMAGNPVRLTRDEVLEILDRSS